MERRIVNSGWLGANTKTKRESVEKPMRHVEFKADAAAVLAKQPVAEVGEEIRIEENKEVFALTRITAAKEQREDKNKGEVGDEVDAVVQCMKKGLKKAIDSISRTENRSLDPKKDFTFKARVVDNKEGYTFVGFSPLCYRQIREFLDTPPEALMDNLCNSSWRVSPAAKSSSTLYFAGTHYVIKTMNKEESLFLRKIIHLYYHHIKYNPHTLLPRYFGHFSLTMHSNKEKVSFVVMNNVFDTGKKMNLTYDLKGSKVGRLAEATEKIQKDLNMKSYIKVGEKRKTILMGQIYRDTEFLAACQIMDYSFLLGVQPIDEERPKRNLVRYDDERVIRADDGGMLSQGGDEMYYGGIIDILQEYTVRKQAENFFRGLRYNRDEISAVSPGFYKRRFNEFMESKIR